MALSPPPVSPPPVDDRPIAEGFVRETAGTPAPKRAVPGHTVPQRSATEGRAPVVHADNKRITFRAFLIGLIFTVGLSWLNCWIETEANVHFLGGVQLPGGAIFLLLVMIGLSGGLKCLERYIGKSYGVLKPFSHAELLTIYVMALFAALISTPGTHNFFLTTGPALFYFSSRENGWARLFYEHIPSWWAPGWNGQNYQERVIEPLYLGGLSSANVPWHAWVVMLVAWSGFLLLLFGILFFMGMLLRRQWIESEALSFPLLQLPLQMVEVSKDPKPNAVAFWNNRLMWAGFAIAFVLHLLRGANNYNSSFPIIGTFQGNTYFIAMTERPWNAMGGLSINLYLGAVGLTYLLTRELAFSFWFFFLLAKLQLVLSDQIGYVAGALPRDSYLGQPVFLAYQSAGGWLSLALILVWGMRRPLVATFRAAWTNDKPPAGEPFSPRFVAAGFIICLLGLIAWCLFAGINLFVAAGFILLYILVSVVIARLVVEGGFLFPQVTFSPLELMTNVLPGYHALGAASVTKLAFLQPVTFGDMRTSPLPALLHTFKIAHELKLDGLATRRLTLSAAIAVVVSLAVTLYVSVTALYEHGGLASYGYFATGPQGFWNSAAIVLSTRPGPDAGRFLWMGTGAAAVCAMIFARSRLLWFPLHPLGYIMAPSFPMNQLWFSIFAGWLIKTQVMRYGGNDTHQQLRPMMIGLILGNLVAMVCWMLYGFRAGTQISYWPA